jgi:Short C-terminal domain
MLRGPRVMRRRSLLRATAVGGVAYQAGAGTHGLDARLRASAAPAPAPASLPAPALQVKLKMLGDLGALHERGVLSDEEFAQQKQRVLEG